MRRFYCRTCDLHFIHCSDLFHFWRYHYKREKP